MIGTGICDDCGQAFALAAPGGLVAFGMTICPSCVDADDRTTQEDRALRGTRLTAGGYAPAHEIGMSTEEREFAEYAQEQAILLRAKYGVAEDAAWTDDQIRLALYDHGLPTLDAVPDSPQGMMADQGRPTDRPGVWRRTNAMHLLAHVMIHGGARCGDCQDW